MKYKVRHTPQANREVTVIAAALAPYPNMGKRIFQEMDRKLQGLRDNPFAWPAYHANPKYRRMNIEGHSIFYIVDESKHEVIICHIYYAKRDIDSLLED
ncbi:type II toxin-antitoxin system RelE/ParE family toxin [Candidatus Saccharibacteria bacterium]|nr:type II toxin-antitoxin system RelE/ParE family toxin [Candidatus Saccharibacteria bacterium]